MNTLNWKGAGVALCLGAACAGNGPTQGEPSTRTTRGVAELLPVADCNHLLDELRAQAIADVNRALDENLKQSLEGWGQECRVYDSPSAGFGGGSRTGSPVPPMQPEHSETNNQVAGVEEADLVQTDGRYLYLVADGAFQVVRAYPAASAEVVARVPLAGEPTKLLFDGRRAVVFSRLNSSSHPESGWRASECTYGYDCDFTGDGHPTQINVFDVSTPAAPSLLRTVQTDSSLLAARGIGTQVHAALAFAAPPLANVKLWAEETRLCGTLTQGEREKLVRAFDALRVENARVISQTRLEDWLPKASETFPGGAPRNLNDRCEGFYVSQQQDGRSILSVLTLDAAGTQPAQATSVVGRPGAVYASASNLYVAARHERPGGGRWFSMVSPDVQEVSTVHAFSLRPSARAGYVGTAVVDGHVINQFAMDEFDGHLRIATSIGWVPDPKVNSVVTVLSVSAAGLSEVGKLAGLAPTEDIRSVRFDGDRGYMVTFKKTDPLFTFDLRDPKVPKVAGELKIPGFSTYLHRMDKDHLLSIGFDAEDHGSFAYFQGLQLQIFDVSDLTAPQLVHKEVIGTRGSTSEAATNHLAFNYYAPKNVLAFPMVVCDGSGGGSSYGRMTFNGLMVYDVTAQGGFKYRGGVAHAPPESEPGGRGCSTWWSGASTPVKRSVFIEDHVYSIGEDVVRVQQLDALGTDVKVVRLKAP